MGRDVLRDAGHATIVTNDAQAALDVFEAEDEIDLLFTDIEMPGAMDGLQLASTAIDRSPLIPIKIASGKHRPSTADMPSQALFLPKPYLSVDMLGAVNRLCSQGGGRNSEGSTPLTSISAGIAMALAEIIAAHSQ